MNRKLLATLIIWAWLSVLFAACGATTAEPLSWTVLGLASLFVCGLFVGLSSLVWACLVLGPVLDKWMTERMK